MADPGYLAGKLLLAMPGMGDPRFAGAAIAIASHDEKGALGFNLARPHAGVTMELVLRQFELTASPELAATRVLEGGPVEPQRGFLLHDIGYAAGDTVAVEGRFALTASQTSLFELAEGKGPERWRFTLGYCGWGAGQLEGELTRHGWMLVDADEELLFGTEPDMLWSLAYARLGIGPGAIPAQMGHC